MNDGFFKNLKRALFPSDYTCDLCGIETFRGNLCEKCFDRFEKNDKNVCPVCGRKVFRAEICVECKSKAPLYKQAVSPLVYSENVKELIRKFKNGNGYLKDYFADLIFEKLSDLPEFECIVYVPMTASAIKKRGYNQTELLAKELSKRTGIPLADGAVIKTKETPPQKGLTRSEREKNLYGCFEVVKPEIVRGKKILLVDDILTTGATADAVTGKLIRAGAYRIYLATIASVENKPFYLPRYLK
ncbi:MAG: ComF family protein [Clostridia bacterium]|nr:ComF family protein [Clostridia bacterium]